MSAPRSYFQPRDSGPIVHADSQAMHVGKANMSVDRDAANVGDEMELYQLSAQFPLAPFSTVEVEILVEGDAALQCLTQRIQALAVQMG